MGGCFQTKNIVERKKIYKVLSLRKNKRMKFKQKDVRMMVYCLTCNLLVPQFTSDTADEAFSSTKSAKL